MTLAFYPKHEIYYTSFYGDGESKVYSAVKDIFRLNLLRSLNVSVSIKNLSVRGFVICTKTQKH